MDEKQSKGKQEDENTEEELIEELPGESLEGEAEEEEEVLTRSTQEPTLTGKQRRAEKRKNKKSRQQERFDRKWDKKKRRGRGFSRRVRNFIAVIAVLIMIAGVGGLLYLNKEYGGMVREAHNNSKEKIANLDISIFLGKEASQIYDAEGALLTELVTHKFNYLKFNQIPDHAKHAIIAIEDERFLTHDGIDYKSIVRAGYELYKNDGKITQGGSTITQQLVKNTILTQEQSYTRKLEEVFIAIELEKTIPKSQILEYYFNNIYFGRGATGLDSASTYYFSKPATELSLEETTFLLAIPNNPTMYDPINNKPNTLKRQQRILKKMYEQEYITEKEFTDATLSPIELVIKEREVPSETYLVSYAISDATKKIMELNGFKMKNNFKTEEEEKAYREAYGAQFTKYNQEIRSGGYIIYTSLDQQMQNMAQDVVNKEMAYATATNPDTLLYKRQATVVVIDNETGLVQAIVGGRTQDNVANTFNRGFLMHRQPGSAIKPLLVYTPAIENGYFARSTVTDRQIKNGPRNVTGTFIGATTIENAVINSINTIPFQLIQEVGIKKSLNYLKELDFTKVVKEDERPTAAIGGMTYGATPLEMAGGFSTLARHGQHLEPTSITSIQTTNKQELYKYKPSPKEVYDPGAAFLMTQILEKTAENTNRTGMSGKLSNYATAVKTGTTNDIRDVWYVGYTPHYTTSVWVGEDTPTRMHNKTSYDDPMNIWHKVMSEINKHRQQIEIFSKPNGALFQGYVNPRNNRVSYTKVKGWRSELIPTSRMKKQEEADAKLEAERQEKLKEQAKLKAEEDKKKKEEIAKKIELERKEEERIDKLLQAQGTSLKEEKDKAERIGTLLVGLNGYQVYRKGAYDTVDSKVKEIQGVIDTLYHVVYKENYQEKLNKEVTRVDNQKDQVERGIILEAERVELERIRAEEYVIKEAERRKLQAESEQKRKAAQEKLDRDKAEAEVRRKAEEEKRRQEELNKPAPIPPKVEAKPSVGEGEDVEGEDIDSNEEGD